MRNTLDDLNNHLFAQLERLGDESLTGDDLAQEVNRSQAVTNLAAQIINNGSLMLKAQTTLHERSGRVMKLPRLMETKE